MASSISETHNLLCITNFCEGTHSDGRNLEIKRTTKFIATLMAALPASLLSMPCFSISAT